MINFDFLLSKPIIIDLPSEVDYIKLYFALRGRYKSTYLFESLALPKQQDRFYTFGFDPYCIFSARNSILTVDSNGSKEKIVTENPYKKLQSLMPIIPATKTHYGGLIGYFSYESVNYFEANINLKEHQDFPVFELGLYFDGLIYDSETAELKYYTYHKDRSNIVIELLASLDSLKLPSKAGSVTSLGHSVDQSVYKKIINDTKEEIKSGNTFQAEVGIRSDYNILGDKFAIYRRLREVNPSPYMYFVKFGKKEVFGSSPELVVSCRDGSILTTPAAGTIKRGANKDEDQRLARQLLSDPKEQAEHAMLVDLHRNDIAKVSKPGSVKVSRLMHLMKFNFVQHIVSDVVGELKDDKDCFDLLAGILPCGVLTGAPKIETMKIINKNEKHPRGPYGGAVGRFSFNGDCAFVMPIRSLFCSGSRCYNQACAGIVFDSNPDNEYDEVIAKLSGLERTIKDASS